MVASEASRHADYMPLPKGLPGWFVDLLSQQSIPKIPVEHELESYPLPETGVWPKTLPTFCTCMSQLALIGQI